MDYGGPDEQPLGRIRAEELREYLAAGEFGRGNMRPKVEACLAFVEDGSGRAAITTPDRLKGALAGTEGTQVIPD
ncbi:amino acid kinase family protein [Natronomonas pharaonis]|uniref:hypothetical protein n=1 Tax=Natronomonas pharaonis TaxID=2257 RepID=UPI0006779941|nr:hypothetical protein [Natronomonas pharaonis]